jgi:hypothetical protein
MSLPDRESAAPFKAQPTPLDRLILKDFESCVNEGFTLQAEGVVPVTLTLVSANALPMSGRVPVARAPFSLLFMGPPSRSYFGQGTYRLEHPRLGGLDLFIVPLGPAEGRMRYEAIFT